LTFRSMSSRPSWASMDPNELGSTATPYAVSNLCDGKWTKAKTSMVIPHPTDRDAHPIFTVPDTQADEIQPFIDSLRKVSKSGKHNPFKNNDRYVKYGEISRLVRFTLFMSTLSWSDVIGVLSSWTPTRRIANFAHPFASHSPLTPHY
jgi:hypothetical protein